jgi:hypothetical protein
MMSLWDALRMNMMISYQELVRTFPRLIHILPDNESIDLILFADHEKIYSQVIFYCKQFNVNYD